MTFALGTHDELLPAKLEITSPAEAKSVSARRLRPLRPVRPTVAPVSHGRARRSTVARMRAGVEATAPPDPKGCTRIDRSRLCLRYSPDIAAIFA